MKSEISNYMREMQRRSAASRWNGLSATERAAKMSALAKARWGKTKRKTKRKRRRSNAKVSDSRSFRICGRGGPIYLRPSSTCCSTI